MIDGVPRPLGTQVEQYVGGFSILADGSQGLRHALPIDASAVSLSSRAALHVRHYLAEYGNGVCYIAHSRLVNVEVRYYGA
ncbi:MAG: hypothetical protein IPK19_25050 [Chloroflexi bacterium]|nr:hypothetical protein [Chloroflexota bacterium]